MGRKRKGKKEGPKEGCEEGGKLVIGAAKKNKGVLREKRIPQESMFVVVNGMKVECL